MIIRLWNRLIAFLFRRVWVICPCCNRGFGSHQAHETQVKIGLTHYRIVCGTCATKKLVQL